MPLFKHNNNPNAQHPIASTGQPVGVGSGGTYANNPTYTDDATAAGQGGQHTNFRHTGAVPPRTTDGGGTAGVGTGAGPTGTGHGLGPHTGAGYASGAGAGVEPGVGQGYGQTGTAAGSLPHTGVGAGHPSGPGTATRTTGTESGSGSLSGKIEHVVGTLIGSESLKAKGVAKEREAAQLKAQATELNSAERFEQEALAHRERAVAHGAHPDHRHLGGHQPQGGGGMQGGNTNVGASGNAHGNARGDVY